MRNTSCKLQAEEGLHVGQRRTSKEQQDQVWHSKHSILHVVHVVLHKILRAEN